MNFFFRLILGFIFVVKMVQQVLMPSIWVSLTQFPLVLTSYFTRSQLKNQDW